jgi:hypothetical protein
VVVGVAPVLVVVAGEVAGGMVDELPEEPQAASVTPASAAAAQASRRAVIWRGNGIRDGRRIPS